MNHYATDKNIPFHNSFNNIWYIYIYESEVDNSLNLILMETLRFLILTWGSKGITGVLNVQDWYMCY